MPWSSPGGGSCSAGLWVSQEVGQLQQLEAAASVSEVAAAAVTGRLAAVCGRERGACMIAWVSALELVVGSAWGALCACSGFGTLRIAHCSMCAQSNLLTERCCIYTVAQLISMTVRGRLVVLVWLQR